jgi:prophage antirepressor-like protein
MMTKTNIQIFTSDIFGEIRTCQVNNQIMFVGKDVATALGYRNPSNALQVHVDPEDKTTYPIQVSGSNYKTNALFVNESGLYALILSSHETGDRYCFTNHQNNSTKDHEIWDLCDKKASPRFGTSGGRFP